MGNFLDLSGRKIWHLTMLNVSSKKGNRGQVFWDCLCDCGKKCSVQSSHITNGHTTSCGCKKYRIKHNLSNSRFYGIYYKARNRCNNINDKRYYDYGGRGIKFMWNKFEDFMEDMLPTYLEHCEKFGVDNTQIDRINNDGNYCMENCRWSTRCEQLRNTRANHLLTFNGTTASITEWAEIININKGTLQARINRGWELERALCNY